MKKTLTITSQMRHFVWPVMGWRRLGRYVWVRLMRLKAAPHAIALGTACGVFTSFTPFIGAHIVLALLLAYLFGGNLFAAGLGTIIGNPLTFPVIWLATYNFGSWLMGAPARGIESLPNPTYDAAYWGSFHEALPILAKMTIGSIPLGVLAAILCYIPVKMTLAGLRRKRPSRKVQQTRTPALS